ncbi:hypothetical protein B7C51_02660 [Paenibacillus larvae subsp. pulvifaciens]|uniref:YD repeat-containing protein n=2 Tax=Paenibacillus larvae TaxID=1464 RepID=A0A1V0UPR5_9BACL|nr:RHS repeat protein [Paenibacillus larvae]ARF66942.1 hypothetical protein B7C51_02660 [Paenibacillus larvae subsp. pulvifaciens]
MSKKKTLFIMMGSLLLFQVSSASGQIYKYDELDRLTSVKYDTKDEMVYEYDAAGNILQAQPKVSVGNQKIKTFTADQENGGAAKEWNSFLSPNAKGTFDIVPLSKIRDEPGGKAEDRPVQKLELESSPNQNGISIFRDLQVKEEQEQSLSANVKTENMEHAKAQIVVNFYDETNKLLSFKTLYDTGKANDWERVEADYTSPRKAVKARIHLQIIADGDDGKGVLLVDQAKINTPS